MTMQVRTSRWSRAAWVLVLVGVSSVTGAAKAGPWQPVGIGDCPGRDVAGSAEPSPDPSKCTASFAGQTAVCWTTGCTYKNVAAGVCTGGANPGQMYMCGPTATVVSPPVPAARAPEPAAKWQPTGIGDCPERDVAGSAGPLPDPAKCNASFDGQTAVCWTTGCTYKSVATSACSGGANPGRMYTCAAAVLKPVGPPQAPFGSPPSRPAPAVLPPQAPKEADAKLRGLTLEFGLGNGPGYGDLYASSAGSPLPDDLQNLRAAVISQFPLLGGLGVRPFPFLSFGFTMTDAEMS